MAKSKRTVIIALACSVCGSQNYTEYKNTAVKDKVEKNKYCKSCKKHTKHVETKVK
ncbi:50S ribosomal protein L33 [Candidatus Dojkabacteria bacterium]|nr:50S ribosomal protein L33 [Candidatus Dojkabacteria bacterium]